MTYPAPAYSVGGAASQRLTLVEVLLRAAVVGMLIIFSQAWIVPIMGENVDPNAGGVIRLVYFPAYLIGLAVIGFSLVDVFKVTLRQPFLIAMLCLAAASMAWSINSGETARRFIAILFTSLAGVAIAARYKWAEIAELMAIAFAFLCVSCFLAGLLMPSLGVMHTLFPGAWRGLWPEKNALGNNMALFGPIFIAAALLNPRRAMLWWGMFALATLLLLLSTSKTSLVAMMLGMAGLVFIYFVRKGGVWTVIATYGAVVGVAAIAFVGFFARDLVFGALGKDATLTGRTEIWSAVLIEVKKHPWLGHGYGTVWTEEGQWGPLAWIIKHAGFRPQHSHSSWMEQLLWLGITGLVTWICFFTQTLVSAIVAVYRSKGAYLALPFVLAYALMSITESLTLTYNDLRWVLFVAIACKLAFPDRERA